MNPWAHQRSVILHTFQILYAECGVHHLKLNPECKVNKSVEMWFVLLDGEQVQLSACEYSVPWANQRCFLVTSAIYFLLLRGQSHTIKHVTGTKSAFPGSTIKEKTGFGSSFPKRFQFQWATRVCLWTRVKCKRKFCDEKTNPHTWGQARPYCEHFETVQNSHFQKKTWRTWLVKVTKIN